MHIHFIIHEHFEAPGAYAIWAKTHAHTVSYSRLYAGDALPQHLDDIDMLIVMGGPQNPDTTMAECPHFNAKAEQALILRAIRADKIVLGIVSVIEFLHLLVKI